MPTGIIDNNNDLSPLAFSVNQLCQESMKRFGIESFGSLVNQ
jgi:hypothetical protein